MNEMAPFRKYINQFSKDAERDLKMLKWAEVKRSLISDLDLVNFENKTVLDVGCSVGYICSWASKVAKYIMGVDIREDILKVAKHVKKDLGKDRCGLDFSFQNWGEFEPPVSYKGKFDIVMCTALLHYFHREEYGDVIAKLAYVCNETLVLEMKVGQDNDKNPRILQGIKAGTTVPTLRWLKRTLLRCGFIGIHRIHDSAWPEGGKGRELWVLRKLPEVPYNPSWPKGFAPGDTVELPMNHSVLDYYYNTVERGTADWWIWVGQVAKNFKPWLFLPIVYQPSRNNVSDGGHRLMVAKRLGHKTIKIRMM